MATKPGKRADLLCFKKLHRLLGLFVGIVLVFFIYFVEVALYGGHRHLGADGGAKRRIKHRAHDNGHRNNSQAHISRPA